MAEFIIRAITLETEGKAGWLAEESYLLDYDADAFDGRGDVQFTPDRAKAMRFASQGEAFAYYRQQSRTRPTRDDGKPNRPLTAFTVEIVKLDA